jgi:integrase
MNEKIWIEKTGNTLRLRWNYEGKKQGLSLGVTDTHVGRAFAAKKMSEISMDLISGHYDPTLLKYRPRKLGTNPTELTAVELFEKYADYRVKDRELSHSSAVRLRSIASKLNHLLGNKSAERVTESVAREAVAMMAETLTGRTVKTYLFELRACWEWAKGKYHIAENNPWSNCIDRVKVQPSKRVKPFTLTEVQAIIATFQSHPQYKHYINFVIFLVSTACRPGEAVGLRWKHLESDFSVAWIEESISRGHQNKKGTKTGKSREVQIVPSVQAMLADRYQKVNPQPEDLVFPAPKGGAIDDHNFCNRAWKTILAKCHVEYRSPYNFRHTAISHALARGANPIALAEQTGHDKRVLLSTYAHAIGSECLFVDIGTIEITRSSEFPNSPNQSH